MTDKEKLNLLEEMLDMDENSLNETMELSGISEWDSMAAISFIALLDDKFGKQISANQIKAFRTISDVLKVMK